jgi:hypothetical protein
MGAFIGGSAWKMVQDIGEGFLSLNKANMKRFQVPDLKSLLMEIEKRERDLRSQQSATDDTETIQIRQRRLKRLGQAKMMLRNFARERYRAHI